MNEEQLMEQTTDADDLNMAEPSLPEFRVFISQPMKERPLDVIEEEREVAITKIAEKFPEKEIVIIDSLFKDYIDRESNIPIKYLARSLNLMADAHLAVFIGQWSTARGCKIEHMVATEYGIEVMTIDTPGEA